MRNCRAACSSASSSFLNASAPAPVAAPENTPGRACGERANSSGAHAVHRASAFSPDSVVCSGLVKNRANDTRYNRALWWLTGSVLTTAATAASDFSFPAWSAAAWCVGGITASCTSRRNRCSVAATASTSTGLFESSVRPPSAVSSSAAAVWPLRSMFSGARLVSRWRMMRRICAGSAPASSPSAPKTPRVVAALPRARASTSVHSSLDTAGHCPYVSCACARSFSPSAGVPAKAVAAGTHPQSSRASSATPKLPSSMSHAHMIGIAGPARTASITTLHTLNAPFSRPANGRSFTAQRSDVQSTTAAIVRVALRPGRIVRLLGVTRSHAPSVGSRSGPVCRATLSSTAVSPVFVTSTVRVAAVRYDTRPKPRSLLLQRMCGTGTLLPDLARRPSNRFSTAARRSGSATFTGTLSRASTGRWSDVRTFATMSCQTTSTPRCSGSRGQYKMRSVQLGTRFFSLVSYTSLLSSNL
mmetsp:Transcript_15622/g.48379  ORF Transcript_15622/g.48379 Transcript_15622/m.48379 type:complete len:473 (-) Transcript_15622:538-1956(-)